MDINELIEKYSLPSPPPEAHYTVYKLTDPNGKVYIGCTGKPVEKRWKKGWNYNCRSRIFKAVREFGWENFEKKILCEKLTREGAGELEKWFIAYYDSANPEKGYNLALGGLGKGVRMSETAKVINRESKEIYYREHPEVIDKIRNSVTSLFENDPLYRERVRKGILAAYENDLTLRHRISKGVQDLYENPEYVRKCSRTHKRYYEEHPEKKEEISRRMKEYLSKLENRAFVVSDTHAKPVICVETGEYFPSQNAAQKATGYGGIHRVCQGFQNTAGGYHWRYA